MTQSTGYLTEEVVEHYASANRNGRRPRAHPNPSKEYR
jgi:hypothetical protein